MKDDSGLENLFEGDIELSSVENEKNISGGLTLTGNIFFWMGFLVLIASPILAAAGGAPFLIIVGIVFFFSSWISSLLFKGMANIIDLLIEIKNK